MSGSSGYRSRPARYIEILKRELGIKLNNSDSWKRERGIPHMKKTDRDLDMDGTLSLRFLRNSRLPFTSVVLRHPRYTLSFGIHAM